MDTGGIGGRFAGMKVRYPCGCSMYLPALNLSSVSIVRLHSSISLWCHYYRIGPLFNNKGIVVIVGNNMERKSMSYYCLLYTSDAADDLLCVDLGGRRIIKK